MELNRFEIVTMLLRLPININEMLLDEVAQNRKQGNRTSKETIIVNLLKKHYDKK